MVSRDDGMRGGGSGILMVALAAVVVLGVAGSISLSSKVHLKDPDLVYGSLYDVDVLGRKVDLLAAVASNGREGYIYYDDWTAASEGRFGRFDERRAYLPLRDSRPVEALRISLSWHAGRDVPYAEAEAVFRSYSDATRRDARHTDGGLVGAMRQSSATGSVCFSEAMTDAVLECSIEELEKAGTVCIPVYADDGMTALGLFPAGSLWNY